MRNFPLITQAERKRKLHSNKWRVTMRNFEHTGRKKKGSNCTHTIKVPKKSLNIALYFFMSGLVLGTLSIICRVDYE